MKRIALVALIALAGCDAHLTGVHVTCTAYKPPPAEAGMVRAHRSDSTCTITH